MDSQVKTETSKSTMQDLEKYVQCRWLWLWIMNEHNIGHLKVPKEKTKFCHYSFKIKEKWGEMFDQSWVLWANTQASHQFEYKAVYSGSFYKAMEC